MNEEHAHVLSNVLKYAIAGSFFGMVLVGAVLWLDISSMKSMFTAADNVLLANLLLSGAMLKVAVLGAMVGTGMLSLEREPTPATLSIPTAERRRASVGARRR